MSEEENLEGDLNKWISLRNKYTANPCIAYLNINSLRGNKFTEIREICKKAPPDIFCIDETKLTDDFPDAQFALENYQYPPFRRDRKAKQNCHYGGGKLVFIKEGLICNRLTNFETPNAETIALELTLSKRKWFIIFAYRPESIDRKLFFDEINLTLSKAISKYGNIVLAGDLNVNMDIPAKDTKGYLSDLCDIFDLTNLINKITCHQSKDGSSLDVILTNRPRSFQKTAIVETGTSDWHSMVLTFLRSHFQRYPPKKITYRNFKNFDEKLFIADLKQADLLASIECENPYDSLTRNFKAFVDRHAPLKQKYIRGNQVPFMTKELSKAIMTKSRLRNKYNKWKSRENYLAFQKSKQKCKRLSKNAKNEHFSKATENGIMTNKAFWKLAAPFLTNKQGSYGSAIVLKENEKIINKESELVDIFNDHYINIVEKSTGTAPKTVATPRFESQAFDRSNVSKIVKKYESHPSIVKIKEHFTNNETFSLPLATRGKINTIINKLDTSKATGPDLIPPKLVKLSADILDTEITKVINYDIHNLAFSENAKTAHVTPLFKKKDRTDKVNYRPVSVLNTFSKIYERFLQEELAPFIDTCLSKFISAYRKHYGSSHVLMRLIESWKANLDNNKFVGAVLMDLSKAFDCVPHDLLIAKLHAYGLTLDTLVYFYSYLKRRKQSVKINNIFSTFLTLLSGVPQGSILGPIFLNIFLNDLLLFIENADLFNFADDNTISAMGKTIPELISTLEEESNKAIDWFQINDMIINAEKSHTIIINKNGRINKTHTLNIGGESIKTEQSVILLGIEIDDKLNFQKYIGGICKRAAGQLNSIHRLSSSKTLNVTTKNVLIESFVYSNFNYCPLVWHFCSPRSVRKMEKVQERALRLLTNETECTYEHLLSMVNKPSLEIRRLRTLATEVFKTINNLNPDYMKEIFITNVKRSGSNKLYVQSHQAKTYGEKSLKTLGPKIWNDLPENIRSATSLSRFKTLIKTWSGPYCKCNLCYHQTHNAQDFPST